MRAARVVWARETAAACVSPGAYAAWGGYLFVVAGLFALGLQLGEGRPWSAATLWTLSVSLPLPALAAVATMSAFAGERAGGTLDLLLMLPVPDREILLGKFWSALGVVWTGLAAALVPWLLFGRVSAAPHAAALADLPASLVVLSLHAATWTALGIFCSVFARRPWQAAGATLLAGFGGALAWSLALRVHGEARLANPLLPLLAELLDAARGRIALRTVVLHLSLAWWFLFAATRMLEGRRWR